MISTDYIINDFKISYKVFDNGYEIYMANDLSKPWIIQYDNFPYLGETIEDKCLAHITTLSKNSNNLDSLETEHKEMSDKIVSLSTMNDFYEECIVELANIVYS